MKMKKLLGVVLSVSMMFMMAGCNASTETGGNDVVDEGKDNEGGDKVETPSDDELSVYLVAKGFQSQYWQAVYQGAEKAAKELGVKLEFQGPDTESDIAQQVQMTNNCNTNETRCNGTSCIRRISFK